MFRLLSLAAVAALATADSPGVQASLSQRGAQYVVNTVLPIIEQAFGTITIPDISGEKDGFDYDLKSFSCSGFHIGSATVDTSASAGVGITLTNLGITCGGDWSFKLHIWPHLPSGSGSVDVTISDTSATLTVDITAANEHPQLTPQNVALNVGSFNISFHGSLWDWLLDLFKGLIQDAVKKAVDSAFSGAIDKVITGKINPMLAAIQMDVPLKLKAPYDIAEVRFGLTANPTVTSEYVGVSLQGDVVRLANPVSPPITPPALPPFNEAAGASYLQMQLSSYTFVSAAYTFFSAGLTDWYFSSQQIPLHLNTTAAYTLIAPGMVLDYPGCAVSIEVSMQSLPSINLNTSGANLTAPLLLTFLVNPNNGSIVSAFSLAATTYLDADLTIGTDSTGGMALMGKLNYLSAALQVHNTSVGDVNAKGLQTLVDFMFSDIVVPMVNTIFGNGIPFPTVGGLVLANTTITYGPQFVTLGSDFAFNPTILLGAPAEAAMTLPALPATTAFRSKLRNGLKHRNHQ